MKKLLNTNSYLTGILGVIISEVLCAALLLLGLIIAGTPIPDHLRWFAVVFVPPLLLLRYYAHEKDYPLTLKACIVALFVTFVAFMWYLLRYHYISFN